MFRKVAFCFLFLSATAFTAFGQGRDIGNVDIAADSRTTSISIGGEPELRALAAKAFSVHGRYRVVGDRASYSAEFTSAGPNQVHVAVSAGSPSRSVFSQTFSGTNKANALYRAADAVVRQTSGLPGFFASQLTFIGEGSGHREVYTSDLFFGNVVRVTNDRAHALSPRWSPDGRHIIYTTYFRTGFPDIYVIDIGSNQRRPLATFKGTNIGGRYSPDGSRVAMVLSGSGNAEIYVGSASGGGARRLTRNNSVEASPAWSPDGSRLIFTSDAAGGPRLFQMSASGGSMTRVPMSVSAYSAEPDWSTANPNLIAFTMGVGGRYTVAVHDLSTGQTRPLALGSGDAVEPCWLADGRHLVFTARKPNSRKTMIVDTETGKFSQLSPSSGALGEVSQANALPSR